MTTPTSVIYLHKGDGGGAVVQGAVANRRLIREASDPYLYCRTTRDDRVVASGEDTAFEDEAQRDASHRRSARRAALLGRVGLRKHGITFSAIAAEMIQRAILGLPDADLFGLD